MAINEDIQSQLAAVQASGGGQDALNSWLASTSYTPSQLAEATGYGVTDVTNAINSAQFAENPYTFTNPGLAEQAQQYSWSPDYARSQDELASVRNVMSATGQPYWVTGTGSVASNAANSVAYLPEIANRYGIALPPSMLEQYKDLTGQDYKPGSFISGFDPNTNKYSIGTGSSPLFSSNGLFSGTQPVAQQAAVPYQQSTATSTAVNQLPQNTFGSGNATNNRSPEQLATIKGTWDQFTSGQKTAAEVKQAMTQYGVNFADISMATGVPVPALYQRLMGTAVPTQPAAPAPVNTTQQPPNFGSPYNPANITPNPDGSGTPYGSTHPKSGMVGGNSGSDYNQTLSNYYNSYFKDAPGVDTGMLSSWYSTGYSPTPTGFSTANKGASSASGLVNSLQWGKPEWDAASTPTLYKYMQQYGISAKDIGAALGFSEQQIIDHFNKYGIDVTNINKASSSSTANSTNVPPGWDPTPQGGGA
jgi:hypothetical protein